MTEDSDSKLRILTRFNFWFSQSFSIYINPFLFIFIGQYSIVKVKITTLE